MKFKGGHFAIGAPLAEFKGGGHGAPVPPRSAAYGVSLRSFPLLKNHWRTTSSSYVKVGIFSIDKSLFVKIVIFIENLNLSFLSSEHFCVSATIWAILMPSKTAR